MELVYRQIFEIADIHVDPFGRVKPSVILYFAQEVAGGHCVQLGLDWETLAKKGMFWAAIRHKVSVTRLPMRGETITVETWPMPTTRVAYPRAMAAYDAQGKELFRSVSLWVLMDMENRAMLLPGKSGVEVPGIVRGGELDAPASLNPRELTELTYRTVGYTELDRNGHMNNTRYLDWVADLLPSTFHSGHPVREFTVCYLSEAKESQRAALSWMLQDDILLVDGHREKTDVPGGKERIFTAKAVF